MKTEMTTETTIQTAHERQVEQMNAQHDFGSVLPDYGSAVANKVAGLVAPMAEALGLQIYDIDYSGGTLRVVLDTPPVSPRASTSTISPSSPASSAANSIIPTPCPAATPSR